MNGIVCEFNPFHNGHEYLLSKAKENGKKNICVMSGNFVQRGEIAIMEKHRRAEMALKNGADVVISLPIGWSMSGAENFAYGSISLLKGTGIVDNLVFGSENNNKQLIEESAQVIFENKFSKEIGIYLSQGYTYADARQRVFNEQYPQLKDFIRQPNNILGVQYLVAAKSLGFNIDFTPISRMGANHDSAETTDKYSSASNIRNMIQENKEVGFFVPHSVKEIIKDTDCADFSLIEKAIMFKLRSLSIEDIMNLPDISEGIENRIFESIKTSASFDELLTNIKTKRYTMARIRRIIMSAAFSVDNSYLKKEPPYIHIIGYRKESESLVSEIARNSDRPVIMSGKDTEKLSSFGKKVFGTECIATDLYSLAFTPPRPCSKEYTQPIIKI